MSTKNKSIALQFAVLIIGIALGYVFANGRTVAAPTISPTQAETSTTTDAFALKVVDRKLVTGSGGLTAHEGDTVRITITVNEDEELHLHGYDKAIDLVKDIPNTLTFTANISGRFPFELEHSKTELGAVSVLPK